MEWGCGRGFGAGGDGGACWDGEEDGVELCDDGAVVVVLLGIRVSVGRSAVMGLWRRLCGGLGEVKVGDGRGGGCDGDGAVGVAGTGWVFGVAGVDGGDDDDGLQWW
ncbi:hypothetical protein F0562_029126 [Nyssa sinensis]|uniref:Uncharacterized protein n=1 Tax=Nyssa sinensis TaxID=561372 RepID=A0A5J5B207_9ASTE|nr:hypothetical protein F0562_029126 [Nyssa sinensis]